MKTRTYLVFLCERSLSVSLHARAVEMNGPRFQPTTGRTARNNIRGGIIRIPFPSTSCILSVLDARFAIFRFVPQQKKDLATPNTSAIIFECFFFCVFLCRDSFVCHPDRIPVAQQALPRVHGGFWEAYSALREKVLAALAVEVQVRRVVCVCVVNRERWFCWLTNDQKSFSARCQLTS